MHIITPYMIHFLEKVENIFNIYIKYEFDKFTENLKLNYFSLYNIKTELKVALSLCDIIYKLKENIKNIIINSNNNSLKNIKDIKINDDFYTNNKINYKDIDNIVSKGINDDILYIFYIFNISFFTKNMIYNNIKFDKNNLPLRGIDYISNIICKYGIIRFNNKIMIQELDNIDENCLNNLINNENILIYNNLSSYDAKKNYTIDYIYSSRMNYNLYNNIPLYNYRINYDEENEDNI